MHSCESCLFFLLALICTGGILVFIYLGYQNTGEFSNKASEANCYEALPHDANCYEALPHDANGYEALPHDANGSEALPHDANGSEALPRDANGYEALPHDANGYEALPHDANGSEALPHDANGYEVLPDDLLHQIFEQSEDLRVLHSAGATCKAWRRVSKDFFLFKSLELKKECDERGTHPQEDLLRAVLQGDKPNGGKLKEDLISCSFGKDQDDTSSKIFSNVLLADVTNLTLPISEAKKILNQNVCELSDDVRSPPFEFLITGGFTFDRTEEIRDQSIDDYIQDNPVVKPYVLYDKTEVCVCTNNGISLWLGFLTLLITKSEAGKSWGGSFELQHLRMKNGKECKINMPPACLGTFENLLLDLAKLAKLLIIYFSNKKKKQNTTLYVLALYNCMIKPKVGPSSSRQSQLRYLKYLRNHLAFSTSARRIALFKAIYQAFKSMVGEEKKNFLEVLVGVTLVSWKAKARCHKLLLKMLTFNRDDPNKKEVCYGPTLKEFLRFLRNLVEHGSEHTIVNGQQLMENVEELDYIAATQFSICIQDMLYPLVMELDMAGRLQIPWNNYCGCKE